MVNEQKLNIKFKYRVNSPIYIYKLHFEGHFERRLESSTFTKPLLHFLIR